MSEENWVVVYIAEGKLAAEMVRMTLESFSINAVIEQESVGSVYGFTVGPLGETQILVPADQEAAAREILTAMENGKLEEPSDASPSEENNKDLSDESTKDN